MLAVRTRPESSENVAVNRMGENALERAPQEARAQVSPVRGGEEKRTARFTGPDLVRAFTEGEAVLDAQVLLHHLETEEARSISDGDALQEGPALVRAADHGPGLCLLALGPDGGRQEESEKGGGPVGNLLVEPERVLGTLGWNIEIKGGGHRFEARILRERPRHPIHGDPEDGRASLRERTPQSSGRYGITALHAAPRDPPRDETAACLHPLRRARTRQAL